MNVSECARRDSCCRRRTLAHACPPTHVRALQVPGMRNLAACDSPPQYNTHNSSTSTVHNPAHSHSCFQEEIVPAADFLCCHTHPWTHAAPSTMSVLYSPPTPVLQCMYCRRCTCNHQHSILSNY